MRSDINDGFVWVARKNFKPRSIIKIKNKDNGKVVYCEYLEVDQNFLNDYNKKPRLTINPNEDLIVISEWYRKKLGDIPTKQEVDLDINEVDSHWAKFRTCINHPQIVVRLSSWLAVISVCLGIVSFILGVISVV
ncbi:hypothetical protein ACED51_24285 [Photobacterium swingsii]|uniref:hypothetical protein n=1 Tax=Photobacterium swingsii TaxID=680026 RepID=UPI00352DBEEB